MNIEHRPGVLCMVIGARTEHGRKYIGSVVELVVFLKYGEMYQTGEKTAVKMGSPEGGWIVKTSDDDADNIPGMKGHCLFGQKYLLPIKDPDQDFYEQKTRVHGRIINGKIVEKESYA